MGIFSLPSMLSFRLTARAWMSLQKKQRLISTVIVGSCRYCSGSGSLRAVVACGSAKDPAGVKSGIIGERQVFSIALEVKGVASYVSQVSAKLIGYVKLVVTSSVITVFSTG